MLRHTSLLQQLHSITMHRQPVAGHHLQQGDAFLSQSCHGMHSSKCGPLSQTGPQGSAYWWLGALGSPLPTHQRRCCRTRRNQAWHSESSHLKHRQCSETLQPAGPGVGDGEWGACSALCALDVMQTP